MINQKSPTPYQRDNRFRVLLLSIGNNTEEEKGRFCTSIFENYGIPLSLLKKIVDRCPVILKSNLTLKKAETLAKTLQSFGAKVAIEEKRESMEIFLEFQDISPYQVALESCWLKKTGSGMWNATGRLKNISSENLFDVWVLIQLFDDLDELITFEEVPLLINPLPPGDSSPFRIIFEGDLPVRKATIGFKNVSGQPLPALDRRKRREWVGVEIKGEKEKPTIEPIELPIGPPMKPFQEIISEKVKEVQEESVEDLEPPMASLMAVPKEEEQKEEQMEEKSLGEALLLSLEEEPTPPVPEVSEESVELTLSALGEEGAKGKEIQISSVEESEEQAQLEATEMEIRDELSIEMPPKILSLDEATQLLEEISERKEEVEEEFPHPFPWIEDFKEAIERYYQEKPDRFVIWFESKRENEGFRNLFHSILTILTHARFVQVSQTEKALENTQKVYSLLPNLNVSIEEIPPLEGTKFFPSEVWKELFHRAMPRLHEISQRILEKKRWGALDLELLLRVIPHMDDKNSRMAIKWIHQLLSDAIEIDFSKASVLIGESLYRVSARLGVLNPYFDHYQGKNSMGDLKIQSLAQSAFPQYPLKIEEPMTWVGQRGEDGGTCFPTHPQCERCLFDSFCPKLFLNIDPSEKGMK